MFGNFLSPGQDFPLTRPSGSRKAISTTESSLKNRYSRTTQEKTQGRARAATDNGLPSDQYRV